MSDEIKKKYQFETKIKLPNMQEILDAASDFTAPSEKKLQVTQASAKESEKKDIQDLAHKVTLTSEQAELQKLGTAVADEVIREAKEKELRRAEELRRLCREREELAQKRAEEEQKIADEEKRKAIQAAREKARARKDAAAAEAAAEAAKTVSTVSEATEEESMVDISELAVNPFDENAVQYRPFKEKEAFRETILEDDYKEEMDLREDSSESVEGDFLGL